MLIGYNNDVDHRGKTFHIQTEDRGGSNDNCIESQLFCGGAILDTKITAYEEHVEGLEGKARNKKIKSIMKASHRSLFKKLLAGKYDEMVGLDPVEKPKEAVEEKFEEFQPGQDRVPQAAVELEKDGIDALEKKAKEEGFKDPSGEEHVGLSKLKDKLAGLKEGDKDSAEETSGQAMEEVSETAVLDAPPPGAQKIKVEEQARMKKPAKPEKAPAAQKSVATDKLPSLGKRPKKAEPATVNVAKTGVKAWKGCDEPKEDLSLTELIEQQLAG